MKITSRDNDNYYPQPESQGGWRFLKDKSKIKSLTNVSLGKLDDLIQDTDCSLIHMPLELSLFVTATLSRSTTVS